MSFDFQEVTTNTSIDTVLNSSTSDDTINITGRVLKLNPIVTMMKYDNVSQKKIEKSCRTGVIGDGTGAVLVMLWEEVAKSVSDYLEILKSAFISPLDP